MSKNEDNRPPELKALERVRVIFGHLGQNPSMSLSSSSPAKASASKRTWLDTLQMNPKMYWPKKYRYTVEAPPGASPVLSVKERDHFEENGFVVVRNLVPKAAVERFRLALEPLAGGGTFDPSVVEKVLNEYSKLHQMLRYVECFCGPNVMAMHRAITSQGGPVLNVQSLQASTVLVRPTVDIHQDLFSLPFRPADRIVCAWTPMDTVLGTAFELVRGTHRSSETILSEFGDKVIYEPLPTPEVLQGERTSLLLAPGDTVLYHPLLAHGFPSPGLQERQTLAIACHFASSECEYVTMSGNEALVPTHLAPPSGASFQSQWKSRGTLVMGKKITL